MKNTTLKLLNDVVLEILEDRRMMSTSPLLPTSLSNGVLNITGSPTADTRVLVDLASNNSELTVYVSGQRETFAAAEVTKLNIKTGSGSDYIFIDPHITIPSVINSGDGNDSVRGGGGNNTIIAGNGNDVLKAEGANNLIQAGSGNDFIYGSKGGTNTLIAGNGNDYLSSLGLADHLMAGDGNDTFVAGNGLDTITHGSGHDVMTGALSNVYLYGNGAGSGTTGGSGSTTSGGGTKTTGGGSSSSTGGSGSTTSGGGTKTGGGGSSSSSGGSGSIAGGGTKTTGGGSTTGGTGGKTTGPIIVVTTPPVTTTGGKAPVAIIKTLSGPKITGIVVAVDGLTSSVGTGTCITSNYVWDFGDAGSAFNTLSGFNAAHVYDRAGNYTISLTVTNEAGRVSKTTQQVTIAASARSQIYVDSANGSDSNRGTQNAPLQSLAAAFSQLQDSTEILLKAGESFYTDAGLKVAHTDILIGRYGTGASPQIVRTLGHGVPTISVSGVTNGLTIQDITFNTPYAINANGIANKIGVGGIFLAGSNCTVRDCTFLNIDDAINENGNPTGVLIQGNNAPLVTGIRGYMVWGQGAQDTIIGNYAANSTREHIVRLVDLSEVNVQGNNFANLNRQGVDKNDFSKGSIEVHRGQYDWIVGNIISDGDIRVGPLGLWGEAASSNTSYCVIEDNQLTDTFIYVQTGTHHAMIANNVVKNSKGQALVLNGVDRQGRMSTDISIINNTATDSGTQGNFIEVLGYVNGIVMVHNLWIAPKLHLGDYAAAPVHVYGGYMNSFTQINGNIWPSPVTFGTYANGGINNVGGGTLGNGYVTPDQWNALGNVGTDLFQNVTLNSTYEISINSMIAGAALKMAA